MRDIWTLQNNSILRNNLILRNNMMLRKTRPERIPSHIIIHHHLHVVIVQYITKTRGEGKESNKVEISVAVVCTSVKILKIRRMVNKIRGHLKLTCVYLPHSKLEGGGGGRAPHPFILVSLKS